jgi:hypothetical protein
VRDEQHALERRAVECREPGLAEARRHDNQPRAIARDAGGVQRGQRLSLDRVRIGRRVGLLLLRVDAQCLQCGARRGLTPSLVDRDPLGGQRRGSRMPEQALELLADRLQLRLTR